MRKQDGKGKNPTLLSSLLLVLLVGVGLSSGTLPSAHAQTAGSWTGIGGPGFGGGMTATRLADGTVALIGGSSSPPLITLYRPLGNAFDFVVPPGDVDGCRVSHTATLLTDGQILVAGGVCKDTLASAELYDPVGKRFIPVGPMNEARSLHTATLLADGTVLITGGLGSSGWSATVELYDPSTRQFTFIGLMTVGRSQHTATLLPNGKVLIVGGDGNAIESTAELYEPSTKRFIFIGQTLSPRPAGHTATLLRNGKVLLAGGLSLNSVAELYDATIGSQGRFVSTGRLATRRSEHTATLLADGKVLMAGGTIPLSFGGSFGGGYGPSFAREAEVYNPDTGQFTSAGLMNENHSQHTATLLGNGKVLVSGNALLVGGSELYSPTLTLSYQGKVQDKVGTGERMLSPDGRLDGTFQVVLQGGTRTVTSLDLRRSDGMGIWNTIGSDGFWTLGASSALGGTLLNSADDAVNFTVADGGSFYLYAAEFVNAQFPNGLLLPGQSFTLTVGFADGTTATATVTIPPPTSGSTVTLAYLGKLQDKVGTGERMLSPDGQLDGTFQVTLQGGGQTVTSLDLRRSDGNGIWNTIGNDGFWSLGANPYVLGGALANAANDAVSFEVGDRENFYLYAADFVSTQFPNGLLLAGQRFTLTAGFADGTTATASVTLGGGGQPMNLALNKTATASSVLGACCGTPPSYSFSNPNGFVPGFAVDGTTTTFAHTGWLSEPQPWLQIDLDSVASIQTIQISPRSDRDVGPCAGVCARQLSDFYVLVSDAPFASTDLNTVRNQPAVSSYFVAGPAGVPTILPINRSGRYVRIQLSNPNTEALSVDELQVIGTVP